MNATRTKIAASALLAAGLTLALAGCGGIPTNRSMYSVHQPVVEKVDYALDVTTGGPGLAYGEQARLSGWLEAMDVKYGDKISLDDPNADPGTRSAVEAVAARYGMALSADTAVTGTVVPVGYARVIVSRSKASVPGCSDWSSRSDFNPRNALSSNYGCAVNSNMAAMIANPEDLLHGNESTGSSVQTSNKAIKAYREANATGNGNTVRAQATGGN